MREFKSMLVIRLSALGDVAMTLPVVYSLARKYPKLKIDVLTRPFFGRLFVNCPDNVNVVEADFKYKYKGAFGLIRLLVFLFSRGYSCVADLHNVPRSWFIDYALRLCGKPVAMVDKQRRERKSMLRNKVRQKPFFIRYIEVFDKLGFPIELDFKSVYETASPHQPIDIAQPSIGIAPFARYPSKTYPVNNMRKIVEELVSRGFHVYLFGAKSDAKLLSLWADQIPLCTSLSGKYTLEEEMAIMSCLDLMVSMDSANQHIASLVNTRVITIWGSTSPLCGFMGYKQSNNDAIYLNLDCQPCSIGGISKRCDKDYACLKMIKIEDIVSRIVESFECAN